MRGLVQQQPKIVRGTAPWKYAINSKHTDCQKVSTEATVKIKLQFKNCYAKISD